MQHQLSCGAQFPACSAAILPAACNSACHVRPRPSSCLAPVVAALPQFQRTSGKELWSALDTVCTEKGQFSWARLLLQAAEVRQQKFSTVLQAAQSKCNCKHRPVTKPHPGWLYTLAFAFRALYYSTTSSCTTQALSKPARGVQKTFFTVCKAKVIWTNRMITHRTGSKGHI